ncbi:MAG: alanine racemase [Candidatus Omnitrophota bacterium]
MKKIKDEAVAPYSWVEIDLSAIEANYKLIKKIVGPRKKILAVVKADAYGHGMVQIARRLSQVKVDYLAVASLKEAITLREAKIKEPILLLNAALKNQLDYLFLYDITATISDFNQARSLSAKAKSLHKRLKVHIEIDTGMGRYGLWHQEIETMKKIFNLPYLEVEGIFTHFPCADTDVNFTKKQITLFKSFLNRLKMENISFKLVHAANSAGVINFPGLDFNMVRPGLALYGLTWDEGITRKLKLKPAMSFKTRIVFLKKVSPGRSISYGRTYITKSNRLIATLAVGYADGYNRLLSNRAQVLLRGKRAKVVGTVCMDNIMIDTTAIKNAKVGDEVVLFGAEKKERIYVEELARICKTIPYEIVCGVSKCVDRLYIN